MDLTPISSNTLWASWRTNFVFVSSSTLIVSAQADEFLLYFIRVRRACYNDPKLVSCRGLPFRDDTMRFPNGKGLLPRYPNHICTIYDTPIVSCYCCNTDRHGMYSATTYCAQWITLAARIISSVSVGFAMFGHSTMRFRGNERSGSSCVT